MSNPLRLSELNKVTISAKQEEEIIKMYRGILKETKHKYDALKKAGKSTKAFALDEYSKALRNEINRVTKSLEKTIPNAMTDVAKGVVRDTAKICKMGEYIKGFNNHIPTDSVKRLLNGGLYKTADGKPWTFAQAIWENAEQTSQDINNIVAKGLAQNKSALEIAQDLETYVKPSAQKPWEWKKAYPGVATKIEYNAQRMARTMIQHSYQVSLHESTRHNPFVKAIVWNAAFEHGRTCEICMDRDGKRNEPFELDHPNGLCFFTTQIDENLDEIADKLVDWANGKHDPGLDLYALKGMGANAPAGLKGIAQSQVKAKTAGQAAANALSKSRIAQRIIRSRTATPTQKAQATVTQRQAQTQARAAKAAQKQATQRANNQIVVLKAKNKGAQQSNLHSKAVQLLDGEPKTLRQLNHHRNYLANIPVSQQNAIKLYTGNAYDEINSFLRAKRRKPKISPQRQAAIQEIQTALDNAPPLHNDTMVFRRMGAAGIRDTLDADPILRKLVNDIENLNMPRSVRAANMRQLEMQLKNAEIFDAGFVSSTRVQGTFGRSKQVELRIAVDKGSQHGAFVESISTHGVNQGVLGNEREFLFKAGTRFVVQNANVTYDEIGRRLNWVIDVIVM